MSVGRTSNGNGKFQEVNNSIFLFAERYMSSKVAQTSELEHSENSINDLKMRTRRVKEEVKQTERMIIKKQKMIKSDIHAYQGLMFEVSATRASLCQRKETKGSIERRMNNLVKTIGGDMAANFNSFLEQVKKTCCALESRKSEYESLLLSKKDSNSQILKLNIVNKEKREIILKTDLSIERLTQEKIVFDSKFETMNDSVESYTKSISDVRALVKNFDEQISDLVTKKATFSNEEAAKKSEVKNLQILANNTRDAMVNEFSNTLRKRIHFRICKDLNPNYESKKANLLSRLEKLKNEMERMNHEKKILSEKMEKLHAHNSALQTNNKTKRDTTKDIMKKKEELKLENDCLRAGARKIDDDIPLVFQKLREFQVNKKHKMEKLMRENSVLESQLHVVNDQNQKKDQTMMLKQQRIQELETRQMIADKKKLENDKADQLVIEFRNRLNTFNDAINQLNMNYQEDSQKHRNLMDLGEKEISTSLQDSKNEITELINDGFNVDLVEYVNKLKVETKRVVDEVAQKMKERIPQITQKMSPPVRPTVKSKKSNFAIGNPAPVVRNNNNVPVSMNRSVSSSVHVNVDENLSHLGSIKDVEYNGGIEEEKEPEANKRGKKRRKLNSGKYEKKTPKQNVGMKRMQKTPEIGGLSDVELEFNFDDVFGGEDISTLSTPVRDSTVLSMPGSNNETPHGILDILNVSSKKKSSLNKRKKTKKKKKKKSSGRKRVSINLEENDGAPKKRSRKRKRGTGNGEAVKKRKKKSKSKSKGRSKSKGKKKKSKKIKKKNDDFMDDLDLGSDSMDLSVFDF